MASMNSCASSTSARRGAHGVVEQSGKEIDLGGGQRAFDLQVAVDGPLLALCLGERARGVGQQ